MRQDLCVRKWGRVAVALSDHINTMPGTPMVGPNDDRYGDRFFSLANAYDADYRAMLQSVAAEEGFPSLKAYLFLIRVRTSKRRQKSA